MSKACRFNPSKYTDRFFPFRNLKYVCVHGRHNSKVQYWEITRLLHLTKQMTMVSNRSRFASVWNGCGGQTKTTASARTTDAAALLQLKKGTISSRNRSTTTDRSPPPSSLQIPSSVHASTSSPIWSAGRSWIFRIGPSSRFLYCQMNSSNWKRQFENF